MAKTKKDRRNEVIGALIAEARRAAGLTQAQLAKQLKVHWMRVSRVELGKSPARADEVAQIAQVLGVETQSLFPAAESQG